MVESRENRCVVTGAFGLTGRKIAQRLLDAGYAVQTLTNKPREDSHFGRRLDVQPLCFDDPNQLTNELRGVNVLFNTYWIRFAQQGGTHAMAVRNSATLFQCAAQAGVRRIVHISIANPDTASPLSYYRGKAQVEQALIACGVPHTILRPAVLFGEGEILINNIAWMLRKLPVFGVFGDGRYPIQPVFLDDVADLAIQQASRRENTTIDAVGPEAFAYKDFVAMIKRAIGGRARIIRMPKWLGWTAGKLIGWAKRDEVLAWQEIEGLTAGLLASKQPPTCPTRFTNWLAANRERLGLRYESELARRRRA